MSLIRWSDEYLVGNEQIDDEHQALFALINDFYDAYMERQRRQDIERVFNDLVKYAEAHFQREEKLMRDAGYDAADDHHKTHERLFEQIFELTAKLSDRAVNPTRDTVAFLEHWLTDHIKKDDMAFAAFLKSTQPVAEAVDNKAAG